jgi:hypothetical protein
MFRQQPVGTCFMLSIILTIAISAGCIDTHEQEFKRVGDLMESASARFEVLEDLDPSNPTMSDVIAIKASAAAAKSDMTEALRILEEDIPPDATIAGKSNLDAAKTVIRVYITYCELMEGPMADALEHSIGIQNVEGRAELRTRSGAILADYQNMKSKLTDMNRQLANIDTGNLQPEMKGTVIQLKTTFVALEKEVDSQISQLNEAMRGL